MRPHRILSLISAAACAAALAACGDTTHNRNASNEGIYVDLGTLKYQVQLSRELNPFDAEDSSYLTGLSAADKTLSSDQAWFGVFMLVFNKHSRPAPAASNYYITDTQGGVYRPTPVSEANAFAYHPGVVQAHDQLPALGSLGATSPTNGAVLLFKVPLATFDNRPLILHIGDPADAHTQATVELDV
jgi:hypothetical protein